MSPRKLERDYQSGLIERIYQRFPGCLVLKNDSAYLQGIPDLTILWRETWAVLEVKRSEDEPYRPNQEWYLHTLNEMSFSATIYPENEEAVLNELQEEFNHRWEARIS